MRVPALLVAVSLGLAACSGGGEGTADPTVPTAPSTSSTTARSIDVSVIPEKIDEPYLNAVLAALDEVDGQATRIIVATKRFPPEAADLLNSIYSDEEFDRQAELWFASIGDDPELQGIKPNPGSRKTIIERVISATPACAFLAVRRDYSRVNFEPGPDRTEYLALVPLDPSNNPKGANTTAWMIIADGLRKDAKEPSSPCP